MNKNKKHCSVCGAAVKLQNIVYTQELEGKVYLVSDVPADVCSQCGEQYLSPDTVDSIQKIVERAEKGQAFQSRQIPVYPFLQVTA